MCETENNQVILFSEISGSQSVRLDIIIFWEVLSETPLTKKKTIHVVKALLIFQYASGSKDSYRRHIERTLGTRLNVSWKANQA